MRDSHTVRIGVEPFTYNADVRLMWQVYHELPVGSTLRFGESSRLFALNGPEELMTEEIVTYATLGVGTSLQRNNRVAAACSGLGSRSCGNSPRSGKLGRLRSARSCGRSSAWTKTTRRTAASTGVSARTRRPRTMKLKTRRASRRGRQWQPATSTAKTRNCLNASRSGVKRSRT